MIRSSSSASRPLRILHVDDHVVNRRLVRDILLSFGHEPVGSCTGAGALERLRRRPFDIVLMDINMPGMNGVEAVHRLRTLPGPQRDIPVIALTSEVTRTVENYLALGFSGFVNKPFTVSELMKTISACTSAPSRCSLDYVA